MSINLRKICNDSIDMSKCEAIVEATVQRFKTAAEDGMKSHTVNLFTKYTTISEVEVIYIKTEVHKQLGNCEDVSNGEGIIAYVWF